MSVCLFPFVFPCIDNSSQGKDSEYFFIFLSISDNNFDVLTLKFYKKISGFCSGVQKR